jgi:RNA polymerase sigma-70 factor (ECF subfamily)
MTSFQHQAKFSTWLFSIIHNTSIDYLRKNKRNVENVLIEKLKDKLVDMVEDEDEIPLDLSIQILEDLLEQLTPQDRMLLVMKYREEHQNKDIQQTLGLSESAIKKRLKRARERINKLHQKYRGQQ